MPYVPHSPALVLGVLSLIAAVGCSDGLAQTNSERKPAASIPGNTRSIHALTVKRIDGKEVPLSSFAGKVLLVVNTASQCGYTPQYAGLELLYERYRARGFEVLGFPSNDFGSQEPGTAEEIAGFCKTKFGVSFPMFQKVKAVGQGRAPLYALLGEAKGEPKWNFHKYLVDKHGQPVEAWPSAATPDAPEIAQAIERELLLP